MGKLPYDKYAIRVNTDEESEELQRHLVSLGYSWAMGSKSLVNLNADVSNDSTAICIDGVRLTYSHRIALAGYEEVQYSALKFLSGISEETK